MTPFQSMIAIEIKEAGVTLDINKGDVLLGGKYKNSPITVEEIGTDELGQPTVNGRKLLAYRIKKKMPEKTALLKIAKFLISKGPATAEGYLAEPQKALSGKKPGPTLPLGPKPKLKTKKTRRPADAAVLLERLTGRQRSGSGYVMGD